MICWPCFHLSLRLFMLYFDDVGWEVRECNRLVSQSSRLRLLAVWYWCWHTDAQPAVPGTVCCNCGMYTV